MGEGAETIPQKDTHGSAVGVGDGEVLRPVGVEVADRDRAWVVIHREVRCSGEAAEAVSQENAHGVPAVLGDGQVLSPVGVEIADRDRWGGDPYCDVR